MSADDVTAKYGAPPPGFKRPDHPDFERLISILTEGIDKDAEQEGFDLEAYTAQYLDTRSLSYVALQRALLAFPVSGPDELATNMPALIRQCALYLEAFIVGYEFHSGLLGKGEVEVMALDGTVEPLEYDFGAQAARHAERHYKACMDAEHEESESPATGPWDGCPTCDVREILAAAYPFLDAGIRREAGH